jgi:hypothetical protein
MAKKKFGLSSTLNKNKEEEPTLPQKVPLTRSSKNLDAVKEKVEALHDKKPAVVVEEVMTLETPVKVEEVAATPKPEKKATPKKKVEKKPERMVRITVDTPKSMHVKLKIKAIEEDITIRDYVIGLIKRDLGLK